MVKIAFWKTLGDAYGYVFANPLAIIRASWIYFFVNVASVVVGQPKPTATGALGLSLLAALLAMLVLLTSISSQIALLRAILLGEKSWAAALQLRYRQWRFLGVGLLLVLLVLPLIAIMIAAFVMDTNGGKPGLIAIAVAAPCIVVMTVVLIRLFLFAPAIAIDDPAKALRAAWHRSRGNIWRLFWSGVVIGLSWSIVLGVFGILVAVTAHSPLSVENIGLSGRIALAAIQTIIVLVIGAVGTAFNAFAFRQLAANWNPPPNFPVRSGVIDT